MTTGRINQIATVFRSWERLNEVVYSHSYTRSLCSHTIFIQDTASRRAFHSTANNSTSNSIDSSIFPPSGVHFIVLRATPHRNILWDTANHVRSGSSRSRRPVASYTPFIQLSGMRLTHQRNRECATEHTASTYITQTYTGSQLPWQQSHCSLERSLSGLRLAPFAPMPPLSTR